MRLGISSLRPVFVLGALLIALMSASTVPAGSAAAAPTSEAVEPSGGASSDDPVIDVSFVDATEGGIVFIDRLVVLADGRVFESADRLSGWQTVRVSPDEVTRLGDEARERGLLDPVDFGDPGSPIRAG